MRSTHRFTGSSHGDALRGLPVPPSSWKRAQVQVRSLSARVERDVQQPSLLSDGLLISSRHDGNESSGEPGAEDRRPLQTLGPVERGEDDPVAVVTFTGLRLGRSGNPVAVVNPARRGGRLARPPGRHSSHVAARRELGPRLAVGNLGALEGGRQQVQLGVRSSQDRDVRPASARASGHPGLAGHPLCLSRVVLMSHDPRHRSVGPGTAWTRDWPIEGVTSPWLQPERRGGHRHDLGGAPMVLVESDDSHAGQQVRKVCDQRRVGPVPAVDRLVRIFRRP